MLTSRDLYRIAVPVLLRTAIVNLKVSDLGVAGSGWNTTNYGDPSTHLR